MGRNIAVGIATRYGPDGPEIKSRCRWDFSHLSSMALELTQPPVKWVPGLISGNKAARAWNWSPTPSSIELKEKVEIYFYPPPETSRPLLKWTLPLPLTFITECNSRGIPDVRGDTVITWIHLLLPKPGPVSFPVGGAAFSCATLYFCFMPQTKLIYFTE
jgi:hypothetical protein